MMAACFEEAGFQELYYQANRDFVARTIAGELVLVPVGEQAKRLSGMITFSETGAFLYELLSERKSEAELVSSLASEFGWDADTVKADVRDFLVKAEKRGIIVRC